MLIGHDAVLPQDSRQDTPDAVVCTILEESVELDLVQVEEGCCDESIILMEDIWLAFEFKPRGRIIEGKSTLHVDLATTVQVVLVVIK